MPAYVLVEIEVRDPVAYERYKTMAQDSIAAFGGRYLVRGGPVEVLEGARVPKRIVVLEFPNAARAKAWWSSAEYAPGKALRQDCARTEMFLLAGMT
jgi:uncharacterized protein (DUF1330 family)